MSISIVYILYMHRIQAVPALFYLRENYLNFEQSSQSDFAGRVVQRRLVRAVESNDRLQGVFSHPELRILESHG